MPKPEYSKTMARTALFALALLVAACGGANSEPGTKSANTAAAAKPADAKAPATKPADKAARQEITMGKADAPVTIIEFASPTCPHCATFHETVFPQLKEKYIDTGVVKLIFREIPTPPQNMAFIGSVLARCAAEKNGNEAYFMVLGTLFKTGHGPDAANSWIFGPNKREDLQKIAAQVGMDQAEFETCMKRQDLVDLIVANSTEAGEKYNISGTPNFVINGKLASVRTFEDFEKAIAEAKGGAKKP